MDEMALGQISLSVLLLSFVNIISSMLRIHLSPTLFTQTSWVLLFKENREGQLRTAAGQSECLFILKLSISLEQCPS
jgi:hypothetical protein